MVGGGVSFFFFFCTKGTLLMRRAVVFQLYFFCKLLGGLCPDFKEILKKPAVCALLLM